MDALQKRIDDLTAQLQQQGDLATQLADAQATADLERHRAAAAEKRAKDLEDAAVPISSPASPQSTVYVSRDRRLPKLKGTASGKDDPDVDEWVADMRAALKSRPMPKREAAEYVFEHLSGEARLEARGRPAEVREDPDKLLGVIQTVFGDRRALPNLFERFYKREQGPKESLLEYSIVLVSAWGKIEAQLDPTNATPQTKDRTLKDRLTEGVHDRHLQRELRRLNLEEPGLTFWEFRERGLKWLGTPGGTQLQAATREAAAQPVVDKTAREILELLKKQQAEMETLREEVKSLRQARRSVGGYCFRCGSPDHYIQDCPVPAGPTQSRGGNRGGQGRGRGNDRGRGRGANRGATGEQAPPSQGSEAATN